MKVFVGPLAGKFLYTVYNVTAVLDLCTGASTLLQYLYI